MIIQHTNFGATTSIKCGIHQNHNYGAHIHQFSELVWVLDGMLEMNIDGKREVGKKGDMFVITPYVIHDFKTIDYSKILICVFSNDFATDFINVQDWYNGRKGGVFTMSETLENYLLSKFINAVSAYYYTGGQTYLTVKAGIHAILDEYIENVPPKDKSKGTNALEAILIYVTNHYNEQISLGSISDALGYSKGYISHCLESLQDFNFTTLVNSLRIEHAKLLLASSNSKSIDIALEVGFSCERSFHRAFKAFTGMTPKEYRQKKRSDSTFENYNKARQDTVTPRCK